MRSDLDQIDAEPVRRVKTLVAALVLAYRDGDKASVGASAAALRNRLADLAPDVYPKAQDLGTEIHYNRLKPFRLAWLFYLVGFLLLLPRALNVWAGTTALLAGFGRAAAEVGAIIIVGGNIDGFTRTMTTAIALETSKGDLPLAVGLGMVLIAIVVVINALAWGVRRAGERFAG